MKQLVVIVLLGASFTTAALARDVNRDARPDFRWYGLELGLVKRLSNKWMARVGFAWNNPREHYTSNAGLYDTSPRMIVGYRILLDGGLPLLWLWLAAVTGFPVAMVVIGVLFLAFTGWILPMLVLKRRARQRTEAIDYELPELIDLLVVTLEAGISFVASLQLAAERLAGPLGVELRITLQEQRMGLTTNEALKGMLDRADTPGMRTFVRSVVQGETLGTSTGQIMRNLAGEMRKRRRSMAEERAQKAPIKILFPLVFLIFPAMFIVLLGPVVYSFGKIFGG